MKICANPPQPGTTEITFIFEVRQRNFRAPRFEAFYKTSRLLKWQGHPTERFCRIDKWDSV